MGLQLPKQARRFGVWALAATAFLTLSACSADDKAEWKRLAMPEGASDRSEGMIQLWQYTWIAAMVTGVLVWALIGYVIVKYRRRSDDEVPVQTRYNLPMEILYTLAPVVMVLVFFSFVVEEQNAANADVKDPDHVIKVVGQQWSWSFNYIDDTALGGATDPVACEAPDPADSCVFQPGTPAQVPTLYLPVGESVRFELSSPDVIHSFWVPAFTYKMDVIPGRGNSFSMTPIREGTFAGKCAELCGTYHSRMLFNVKVVSAEEYATQLQALQAKGNIGVLVGGSEATTQAGLDSENGAQE